MKDIADTLIRWYSAQGRDLPWRHTRDPYKIWLSEVILQQTRVAQGWDYYEKFTRLFPDVQALAEAPEAAVLKAWEGLGYYSRARNLQKAAREVVEKYSGALPQTSAELERLPGIGPYTARAIASFAYGESVAVVDGNVFRVISRVMGDATPIDQPAARKHFQRIADQWLGSADPALFNHAMMDFGATLCTPRSPACQRCPLADVCVAFAKGKVDQFPVKGKKMERKELWMDFYFYLWPDGGFTLTQRTGSGVWKGLWVPPNREVSSFDAPPAVGWEVGRFTHEFTHQRMHIRVVKIEVPEQARPGPDQVLVDRASLAHYALPKAVWKMLDLLDTPPAPTLF